MLMRSKFEFASHRRLVAGVKYETDSLSYDALSENLRGDVRNGWDAAGEALPTSGGVDAFLVLGGSVEGLDSSR